MRDYFGGDPHFNNVVLQLPLRSHLRDESKSPKTVTVNGNTVIVNAAAYFDGTGDYLSLADSTDFAFGAGDFTIEHWVYATTLTVQHSLTAKGVVGGNGWWFGIDNSGGTYGAGYVVASLNNSNVLISNAPISALAWTHIAFTRRGEMLYMYINGVLAGSVASTHNLTTASTFYIGAYKSGTASLFGYIKDLRITKGVARYTSNFTPPTILPTHGVAALSRRVPLALSEVKRPPILRRRGVLYSGVEFRTDLPSDLWAAYYGTNLTSGGEASKFYCITAGSTDTRISAGQFGAVQTVQGAIYTNASSQLPIGASRCSTATLIAEVNVTSTAAPTYARMISMGVEGMCIRGRASNSAIEVFGYVSGTLRSYIINSAYTTGRNIYAATYDGSNFKVYKNGTLIGTSPTYTGVLSAMHSYINITHDSGEYLNGQIIRCAGFARAMTIEEINYWSYGVDFAKFFSPRAYLPTPMLADAARPPVVKQRSSSGDPYFNNVVLLAPLNRGSAKDVKQGLAATLANGAHVNSLPPGGNGITGYLYLDGTDDRASWSDASLAVGTNDFTIECWISCSNYTQWDRVWELGAHDTAGTLSLNISSATNTFPYSLYLFFRDGTGYQGRIDLNTFSFNSGDWAHVAIVRKADRYHALVNGVYKKLGSAVADNITGSVFYCGCSTTNLPLCRYNDIRITKGVARYINDPYNQNFITTPYVVTRAPRVNAAPIHGVSAVQRSVVATNPIVSSALSAIYQDALLQWAMAGGVYREAPYQWNTLNSLLRTAQVDWHLTNAAQRDASAAWDTIAAAYREATLNWHSAGTVLRAAGFDWGLLNTAERTAQADWHIANAAMREAGLDWTTIAAAVRDGTMTWDQSGSVLREANLNWDAIVSALRSADANWHLANAAQRDVQSDWNTIAAAMREAVSQWDMGGGVFRDAALAWSELNAAQRDAVAQWIVAISVNRPADLQWIVAVAAARSVEARWSLLLAVERDNLISWNKIGNVFREAGLDWSMLEPFIHEGHIDWNLANSAEAQAELAWALVQAAERDAEVRFNLATAAFQDAETAWNVLSAAVRDMTTQWDLLGAVLRSMDAQWDDIVGIEKSSELAWNVAISAARSLEHAWNTLGNAAKDATIQWTKIGTVEGSTLLEWKIIPLYGTESPPQYILVIEEENRVAPVDFESRSRVVSVELRTLMVPPAEDDTYGKIL